jgi:hypothetical protein
MDRLELRKLVASRLVTHRLAGFEQDVYLKPLSGLDRARAIDKYKALQKQSEEAGATERMTIEAQAYVIVRSLVDANGTRTYQDDETEAVAQELPCDTMDDLANHILEISGMRTPQEERIKNSVPTPSESSPIVLH